MTFGVHGQGVVLTREDKIVYLEVTVLAAVPASAGTVTATLEGNGSIASFHFTYTVPPAQGLSGLVLCIWRVVGTSTISHRPCSPAIYQ